MAVHKRNDLNDVLAEIARGAHKQVYLCCGERYLCQQAAGRIEQALIEKGNGAVHTIDGAAEDQARILSRLQSFSLLPGRQIYRISDSRLFISRNVAAQLWDKATQARQAGKPEAAARYLTQLLALASRTTVEAGFFKALSAEQWQASFGFAHPGEDLSWADRALVDSGPITPVAGEDAAEKLISAIERGFPGPNILLLLAENVDKRKRLFTCIKKHGEVIDCTVAEGASRAALEEQKQVVREMAVATLAEFGKTIEPKVLERLFERIGFHPVAVVRETEKLALFADERPQITATDLDLLVGRTREEAIFELTEALAVRNTAKALVILHHLLYDGIHGLAIIAALRNFLRRLLIFRSLQFQRVPPWKQTMTASEFQNSYLPALKESGAWPELLKGHPYALFMSFTKAAAWPLAALQQCLSQVVEAEFRLKGTPLPQHIILETLLISLITGKTRANGASTH